MDKYNNLKIETNKNINPEFFNLFAEELEQINKKEKNKNNLDTTESIINNQNTNDNIVIFISKREIRIVKKLLTLVDKLMINSNKK